jgi:formylglycine-generating enzyme required for sulfatase activity
MKKLLFIILFIAAFAVTKANNIQVTNVSVVPANSTIKFDVSWDNGWRSNVLNNWDAAWVFIKYKDHTNEWINLTLNTTGNTIPSGFSSNAFFNGVYLYRSTAGSGTTTISNVEIGIPAQQATGIYDIKVFALEMVYIPQAPFFAGDNTSGAGVFSREPTASNVPAYIITEYIGNNIYDPLITPSGGYLALPPSFPKGYGAFYIMKYELSQGAYRDFLNTLTYVQQVNHTISVPTSAIGTGALVTISGTNRNYLEIKTSGSTSGSSIPAEYGCDANNNNIYDEATDGEWVACNYLNWPDMAAYLGWAGLRPITELEYEKAARGIQLPIAGEYAWGSAFAGSSIAILSNPNQNSEIVSNAAVSVGNANYNLTYPNSPNNGPLRNGVYATATSTRVSSGSGFYGVMELSGNLFERVICTTNGSGFSTVTNLYGLDANGYVSVTAADGWPGAVLANGYYVNGTQNAIGLIDRGGGWSSTNIFLRTSYRVAALLTTTPAVVRDAFHGCRGGKTAP